MSTVRRLLSQTAEILSGGETLDPVTRRPVEGGTTIASGVACAASKRSDRGVIYDETGAVVTDYDVRLDTVDGTGATYDPPGEGDRIRIVSGEPAGEYVVTGETRRGIRRTTGRTLLYSVPARRIDT